jgi:succinyl-CoA synthetase alpha subunit
MSILVNKHTRVITQGVTGKSGQFHTAVCRGYGNGRKCFVAGVNPKKAGESLDGMPVFGTVEEARAATGATVSVVYVPAAFAAAAIEEAVDAGIELVVCVTQGIAPQDMVRVRRRLQNSRTVLLGPNCAGVMTPREINIGMLPIGAQGAGRIGIVSRGCTLGSEAAGQLAAFGFAPSTVVCLGGDPVGGLGQADVLKMFDDDAGTDAVLSIGGLDIDDDEAAEETGARWIAEHMRKPVVAFDDGPAASRTLALMQAFGIRVAREPAAIGALLASVVAPQCLPFD